MKTKPFLMVLGIIFFSTKCFSGELMSYHFSLIPVLDLLSLDPPFKAGVIRSNHLAIDSESHVYIIDRDIHRILKYDAEGAFLKHIGSADQGPENLYFPAGVSVHDDVLVVLNREGRELKMFDRSGRVKHTVDFPRSFGATSIYLCDSGMYVDVKIYHGSLFKDAPLIRHVSLAGEELPSFGEIISTSNFDGYANFNEINIAEGRPGIVGAFKNWPVICSFDDGGNLLFRRDLRLLRIAEVEDIESRAEREGLDTPDNIVSVRGIHGIRYNSGIILSPDRASYLYAIAGTPVLLVFDLQGELIGQGELQHESRPVIPHSLLRTQAGRAFLLGSTTEKRYCLYEISISKK